MKFSTRRDLKMILLAVFIIILTGSPAITPILVRPVSTAEWVMSWLVILFSTLITLCLSWIFIDMEYRFDETRLVVKAGPIRSKIPYHQITKVRSTSNPWFGYRIMGTTEGISVYYKYAAFGCVKITPEDEERFIEELFKRNPNIDVDLKSKKS